MKKLSLILGLAVAIVVTFGLAHSFAQDMQDEPQVQAQIQNDQVTEITESELPDAVAEAWENDKAEGDEVSKVYKITSADGTERFRIEYVDASSQSQYVEYDAEGNEI